MASLYIRDNETAAIAKRLVKRSVVTKAALVRELAVDAHRKYGRSSGHPAQLKFGDCVAYACAKTNDARLFYERNDFGRTDLA